MVETNKPSIRKPRPSPKGTGKDTNCRHTSIIFPEDVAIHLEKEVYITDSKGNRVGKKTGASINSIVVEAVREKYKLPIPKYNGSLPINKTPKSRHAKSIGIKSDAIIITTPIEGDTANEILMNHHEKLSGDPHHLPTQFIADISGIQCPTLSIPTVVMPPHTQEQSGIKILKEHHEKLSEDPEHLSTAFISELSGVKCPQKQPDPATSAFSKIIIPSIQ